MEARFVWLAAKRDEWPGPPKNAMQTSQACVLLWRIGSFAVHARQPERLGPVSRYENEFRLSGLDTRPQFSKCVWELAELERCQCA
jgi:hypothetical protein